MMRGAPGEAQRGSLRTSFLHGSWPPRSSPPSPNLFQGLTLPAPYLQLAGAALVVLGAVPGAARGDEAPQLPDLVREAGLQLLRANPEKIVEEYDPKGGVLAARLDRGSPQGKEDAPWAGKAPLLPGSSAGAASPLAGSAAASAPAPPLSPSAARSPGTSGSTAPTAPAAPASGSPRPTCQRGAGVIAVLVIGIACPRATDWLFPKPPSWLCHTAPCGSRLHPPPSQHKDGAPGSFGSCRRSGGALRNTGRYELIGETRQE